LINVHNDIAIIAACAVFGFSVGNVITLPSLILQREFAPRSYGVLVSLITTINQITYAFGPGGDRPAARYGQELCAAVLWLHQGRVDGRGADHGARARHEDLILRSGRKAASRRMGHGPHGSPGDAKHRPETAVRAFSP
jgi:hypothetical protein